MHLNGSRPASASWCWNDLPSDKGSNRPMRFRSTSESITNGEITVLAVIECFLSGAIYLVIALYAHTWLHFAIAAAFAPMFLFRTRYSTKLGLGLWKKMWSYVDRIEIPDKGFSADNTFALHKSIVMDISFLLSGIFVRIVATAIGIIRHPRQVILSIPNNWTRQALCTDICSVPELIPGEASDKDAGFRMPSFASLRMEVGNSTTSPYGIVARVFLSSCLIVCYIPSIILRLSFKSTWLCYLPLLFVARFAHIGRGHLKWKLQRIADSELEKFRRKTFFLILPLAVTTACVQFGMAGARLYRKAAWLR